jgi:hypothetical protein
MGRCTGKQSTILSSSDVLRGKETALLSNWPAGLSRTRSVCVFPKVACSLYTPHLLTPNSATAKYNFSKVVCATPPPSRHCVACCMSLVVTLRQIAAANKHLATSAHLLICLRRRLLVQSSCASILRPLSTPQITIVYCQICSPAILQYEVRKVWRWLRRLLLGRVRHRPSHRPASCDNGVCPGSICQVHGHQQEEGGHSFRRASLASPVLQHLLVSWLRTCIFFTRVQFPIFTLLAAAEAWHRLLTRHLCTVHLLHVSLLAESQTALGDMAKP